MSLASPYVAFEKSFEDSFKPSREGFDIWVTFIAVLITTGLIIEKNKTNLTNILLLLAVSLGLNILYLNAYIDQINTPTDTSLGAFLKRIMSTYWVAIIGSAAIGWAVAYKALGLGNELSAVVVAAGLVVAFLALIISELMYLHEKSKKDARVSQ